MPPKSSSGKSGGSTASGSGSQSPRSSSSPTIPERVGSWAMDDLALTWDNCDHIRSRLRNYEHLMKHVDHKTGLYTEQYCEKTVANLRANATVLSPLFKLMSRNERTLPSLDRLMEQVSKLFLRSKVTYTKNGDRIYQESWAIRRLCSLGKAQIHRGQWPKDPHDQTWSMNPISWILLFYVRPVRHLSIDIRGWKHIGNVEYSTKCSFLFFHMCFPTYAWTAIHSAQSCPSGSSAPVSVARPWRHWRGSPVHWENMLGWSCTRHVVDRKIIKVMHVSCTLRIFLHVCAHI